MPSEPAQEIGDRYGFADLRLWAGGDPTYVWDWYKSNGCLFGLHRVVGPITVWEWMRQARPMAVSAPRVMRLPV
ncbi:hypothetical protein [Streptomyces sp. NPDC127020]|uniref:hypothetical protein n=1 Tax=Streptomyces sp. NPDC127020 TaxID=3347109 RepID=UPI003669F94E